MKTKKLLVGLGASLCFATAFMLTGCEGSKKITYVDENGEEHTVTLKKTSNEDEIAESLTAFLYSKGNQKFKPNGLGISFSSSFSSNSTYVPSGKKFIEKGTSSGKLMFTFGKYEKNRDLNEYAAYGELNYNYNIPFEFLKWMSTVTVDDANVDYLLNKDIDFSKTTKFNAIAKLYADSEDMYLNVSKLELPYDEIEKLKPYEPLINDNIVGKYIKFNEETLNAFGVPSTYTGYLFNVGQYARTYYSSYTEDTTFVDFIYKKLINGETFEESKEELKEDLKQLDLVISSVDGNKMTLKFKFAKKGLTDEEKKNEYQGNSYVTITFDITKKVPISLKYDIGDYTEYTYDNMGNGEVYKDTKCSSKGSFKFNYNPSVPRLSNKIKEDATNLPSILGILQ